MAKRDDVPPPIEDVATRIRDLRQTAKVLIASAEVVPESGTELERVAVEYDRWLEVAARQVDVDLAAVAAGGPVERDAIRRRLEKALTTKGWLLDG